MYDPEQHLFIEQRLQQLLLPCAPLLERDARADHRDELGKDEDAGQHVEDGKGARPLRREPDIAEPDGLSHTHSHAPRAHDFVMGTNTYAPAAICMYIYAACQREICHIFVRTEAVIMQW